MPLSISSPKVTVKDRIKTDWDKARTLQVLPDFHMGTLNPNGQQYQVVFPTSAETTATPSGYDAMAPDGPVSRRVGTIPCMVFGRRNAVDSQNDLNPRKFVELGAREVERIIHAAFVSEADFEYMSVLASSEIPPDTKHEPPFFGWTVMVQYTWRKTLT